ncbi:homeobox protein 5 [Toxorhynchites rutilus septentrionalis]|uniref:homeobox protein 5 n=1 Tax=Toxorhynchites rutilus septentrionalis TaxID=329112 RepID=UPI002479A8A4|nr:homeobox protein 5 [Toxorhynchites rutilus septentrionalis]XP_055639149.1 homeobox protein 5 [Toxorhynchites rutilus septentrionalis]
MRELDSSETSVVWPAWCYSGETVNEDLPQAVSAAALSPSLVSPQQQQHQQQRFLLQQSSSNQSQSSSASSSPSSAHSAQGAGKLSSRSNSGAKRKSITPTSPGSSAPSALSAALGASSVAALATAAAAAAAAAFQASPRRPTPPTTGLQLQLPENGNGRRGSPSHPATPNDDDHYSQLSNNNNNNNNSSSNNFNSQVAALQSLDKMLSERIYDRKKFLNSPTGTAAAAAAAAAAATSFYEKFRNGAAAAVSAGEMELNQLNLIKNCQSPRPVSDLSAISNSNNNNNNNSGNSGNSANGSSGLLVTANGGSSSSGGSVADGTSGNSLSNSNNQTSNNNNTSSSSSSGSTNNSNNNSIKSERFSPNNNDVQSTASRSRSVTPSSFSGTPPQTMHAIDVAFPNSIPSSGLIPSPNSAMTTGRPKFHARNYSDFMRSLAAKYNNNNNNTTNSSSSNDPSSVKNPFLEPKIRTNQPKSFIENSLVGSKKSSPITSAQVPNPSIMSSLFPGLPFQSTVFPPLIDMSSTQALVALARAAKDSGIQSLLKPEDGGLKKPSAGSRGSSPPPGASLTSHFPSPFPPRYLPGMLPNQLTVGYPPVQPTTAAVPVISPLKSPSRPTEGLSTFPLDLSSAPSSAKRIKLSPTPSRNQETSPAPSSTNSQPSESLELKLGAPRKCHARIEEISSWTVDNVCDFVGSIDICAEYVQNFRDQSIDGAGLPLLTEEHLTNSLGMKLGPALKLKSMLAKKLGGPCPCALCAAPTPTRTSSKGDTTPTNRPPSNGSVG